MSPPKGEARPRRLGGHLSSVRGRVLVVVITITALTVLAIGAATHWVRLGQIQTSVVENTDQEAGELQRLLDRGPAAGVAPAEVNDEAFSGADQLLWTFMSTSVPAPNEVIVGVVDGQVTYTYDGAAGEGLDDAAIERAVREHGQEGRTVYTTERADGRTVGYGLINVQVPGDERVSYLVVATDITEARQNVFDSWWRYVAVSLIFLALAAAVAFFAVGRVTAPISRLRAATADISPQDLSQRVEVPGQDSDVTQLAANFNSMLDRIQLGFEQQRQFLDDATHELRTPLTILHGNLELMDEHDPSDTAETRDLMLDEITRMNRLIEDLLLLAKSRRPDFIQSQELEVSAFLEDAFARIRGLSEQRSWIVDATADGLLHGDRERLMQAVIQLAANAVKFTAQDDTIGLGAMWVEDPERAEPEGAGAEATGPGAAHRGRWLELWVRDTGIGIEPADQKRIFERFGRAGAGRSVEGSGLGLSIVSAIAAGHGGRVGLRSSPGSGSWFTLHLPVGGRLPEAGTGRIRSEDHGRR